MKTAKIKVTQYFEIPVKRSEFYTNMSEAEIKSCLIEHVFTNVVNPQELHHIHKIMDCMEDSLNYKDSPNRKAIIQHHKEWKDIIENKVTQYEVVLPENFNKKTVKRKKKK